MKMYEDYAYKIKYWINYIAQNYDPILKWYGGQYMDTKLTSVKNDQVTHRTFKGRIIASCQVLTYYKEPWFEGFILNVPRLSQLSWLYRKRAYSSRRPCIIQIIFRFIYYIRKENLLWLIQIL